jgi:hypothetical protein
MRTVKDHLALAIGILRVTQWCNSWSITSRGDGSRQSRWAAANNNHVIALAMGSCLESERFSYLTNRRRMADAERTIHDDG